MADQSQNKAVQTTGHAWDGDLQEFNNPLPTWWLWACRSLIQRDWTSLLSHLGGCFA